MARWNSSSSSLGLFAFFCFFLISSNSASLTYIPSWTAAHQLHTRSPEFNVVSTDDGVPTLESGEKPAKDPQIIVEGPLPIETPDPIEGKIPSEQLDDADIIDSTPIPPSKHHGDDENDHSTLLPQHSSDHHHDLEIEPSPEEEDVEHGNLEGNDTEGPVAEAEPPKPSTAAQSPEKSQSSKKPNPSAKVTSSSSESPELDKDDNSKSESSLYLEDESDSEPDFESDNGSFTPEPSALPNHISSSEPSTSPVAWPSSGASGPGKGKKTNTLKPNNAAAVITPPIPKATAAVSVPKPSVSTQLMTAVPNNDDIMSEETDAEPESSLFEIAVPDPSSSAAPTAILPPPELDVGNGSDPPLPSVQSGASGSKESTNPAQEDETASSEPPVAVIEPETAASSDSPGVAEESTDGDIASLPEPSSDEPDDVVTDDTYSCLFFGEGDVPGFSPANLGLLNGTVDTYTAAKTFGTSLPPQYLSHTFGKLWTYSLLTEDDKFYDIVLGFAEIFGAACASDVDSGFRVFSVSTNAQSIEIDVMKTVGCGKPLKQIFPRVSPENGVINLHFQGIVQNAMLSTMCYRQSEASDGNNIHELHTPSPWPESSVTKPTPDPSGSSVFPPPSEVGDGAGEDESGEKVDDGFVQPNGTYTCVNFAAKTFGNYQLFDPSFLDGDYSVYKGSGVTPSPSLPVPYRYHVYGEEWTYHLNVTTNSSQNVVLGFAEVFPKACASGRHGSFRVFTVSVGDNFKIVDVMKSSGCGVVLQALFEDVMPKDQVIDLNFNALSGKAMVSVICYGDANASSAESTSTQTQPTVTPEPKVDPGTSVEDSKQSQGKCFLFGAKEVKGFTNFVPSELENDILMYADDSAFVNGTSFSEVYNSHIFGAQFALIFDVGSGSPKTIELGFAEIYEPGCKEGFRVFTVEAGGESTTIDVFKEVGCDTLFTLQLESITPSNSGMIAVVFKSIFNFAMISSVCIIDDDGIYSGKSPSLMVVSVEDKGEDDYSTSTQPDGESNAANEPANQTQSEEENLMQQSTEPGNYDDSSTGPAPQESPFPKENGLIIVDSTSDDNSEQGRASGSPYPKVNGIIDASITVSPTVTGSPTAIAQPAFGSGDSGNDTTEDAEHDQSSMDPDEPQPSDELLPSDFSQTTLGEDPNSQQISSLEPTVATAGPPSEPGLSGASGEDTDSSTTTAADDDVPIAILPTRTPTPSLSPSPFVGGSNNSVTNKQGDDVNIEALSPSPTVLTVAIEAPSPSATGLIVTIEAPSPSISELIVTIEGPSPSSSLDSVIIVGSGPAVSASVAPTPTIISAAAFSPVPSAAISPSSGENAQESSSITPQPLVTAAVPGTASAEPSSLQSSSPLATPSTGDEVLPPTDFTPDDSVIPDPSSTNSPSILLPEPNGNVPDSSETPIPVNASSDPQGTPNGFNAGESAVFSQAPAATISQNQIVVIPSASELPVSTQTPAPGATSPSPPSTQTTDPEGSPVGLGAPDGAVLGSPSPGSSLIPSGSPIPDIVSNPSAVSGSSLGATPSPSRATSSVGSSEVIVDSPTSAQSPEPVPSISVGGPDEGPVEVADNTTEIFEVTGDIGTGGSEADNQPSILVGEYKDLITTTPAGSGFAIAMGLVGSLLVILLLVCLFFAIFRGGGAAYSYSSGYSSRKPTDYDPSQGRYTDDLGLGPTGYGNEPRYGQNTQDGYGTDPVTFESEQGGPSEGFGFGMPASGNLGTAGDTRYRNEEPDTIAEYSSLNLQPSGYDVPRQGTTEPLGTREIETEQATPNPQFLDTRAYHPHRTPVSDSYGSNPGEYTFTGTFSMPQTRYSQGRGDPEDKVYRDSDTTATKQKLQESSTFQDSFNDHHSTAQPTMTSESSGKQGRFPKNFTASRIMEDANRAGEFETKVPVVSQDATMVDDVRSSLLDSEQGSSTYKFSMGSNPAAVQSPYETQFNMNMGDSESGNVTEQDIRSSLSGAQAHLSQNALRETQQVVKQETELPAPVFDRNRSELITGVTNSGQTKVLHHSAVPSSATNDEPWPWWWSGENVGQHRMSPQRKKPGYKMDGKENSSFSSNGITAEERYQNPGTRDYRRMGHQGDSGISATAKSGETKTDQRFVPDSSWRRQYSSTSDEGEDETTSNPYFEELRRRREPYVRSVANRLSAGPGSFSIPVSGEPDPEGWKKQVALDNTDTYAIRSAREVSSWITRDPAEA